MAYQTVNPTTNKLIRSWPDHDDNHVEHALQAAAQLYKSDWSKGSIKPRLQVLRNLADLLDSRAEELAKIATNEMGKLISQSRAEVKLVSQIARFFAENSERFLAPQSIPSELGDAWVEHHPIGVLLAVEPWNVPYYQLMRILAPNLAAGNPILAKHSGIVPHCASVFEELVHVAGAPEGAWTNLFITSDQVSTLIADDRVQGVAMTGSERAGSVIAAQAGKYLKKTTLELGGNDVFVVLEDCDLDKAVELGTFSRMHVAGQECIGAKRFVVKEQVAELFLEKFTAAFKAIKIGDPLDESSTLGPLSSLSARDGIARQVNAAVSRGATLHYGGKPLEREGCFFEPTILTNVYRENPAYFEEFFGPVAQVYVVKDDEEIVTLANDSNYGLSGVIFSKDIERAKRLASRIETGAVWINTVSNSAPELPFGGVKRSGYGRELSEIGIKEFVNQKLVVVGRG